jgi:hypothetical protein
MQLCAVAARPPQRPPAEPRDGPAGFFLSVFLSFWFFLTQSRVTGPEGMGLARGLRVPSRVLVHGACTGADVSRMAVPAGRARGVHAALVGRRDRRHHGRRVPRHRPARGLSGGECSWFGMHDAWCMPRGACQHCEAPCPLSHPIPLSVSRAGGGLHPGHALRLPAHPGELADGDLGAPSLRCRAPPTRPYQALAPLPLAAQRQRASPHPPHSPRPSRPRRCPPLGTSRSDPPRHAPLPSSPHLGAARRRALHVVWHPPAGAGPARQGHAEHRAGPRCGATAMMAPGWAAEAWHACRRAPLCLRGSWCGATARAFRAACAAVATSG